MAEACDLVPLLPEVQEALSEHFDSVDCSLNAGPDLSRSPFKLLFRNIGTQVTYLPDCSFLEDFDRNGLHEIPLGKSAAIFSDGREGLAMEIALIRGREWKAPLREVFDRVYGSKWAFFILEVERGRAAYHVLAAHAPSITVKTKEDTPDSIDPSNSSATDSSISDISNFSIWIVPVTRIFALPTPVKKVKVVKRVVKKKSPAGETVIDGEKKIVKVVKKKTKSETPEGEETPTLSKTGTPSPNGSGAAINGKGNGSAASSGPTTANLVDSKASNAYDSPSFLSKSASSPSRSTVTASKNSLPQTDDIGIYQAKNCLTPTTSNGLSKMSDGDDDDDIDIAAKIRAEIRERERRGQRSIDGNGLDHSIIRRTSSRSPSRLLNPILEGEGVQERSSKMRGPDLSVQDITRVSRVPNLPSLPHPSRSTVDAPSLNHNGHYTARNGTTATQNGAEGQENLEIPVLVLQLIFKKCFTFEELGHLRVVHPHWDEMAGQLLNTGYYRLLERTDKLLQRLQRRLIADSALHHPIAVLTNIQVHILNPVDIMRAALDEGICCFPYGIIIDKTMELVDEVQKMIDEGKNYDVPWEPVAVLARRASHHYRDELDSIMEERLGTCVRLKAAQRIIRMDSMIIEANVQKIEKDSSRTRDELKWELEQLQTSNQQLRKENRAIKADHMRLEARVENLEQKLKTIARMLV